MADIVLKDRDGNPVIHEGVDAVRMVGADGKTVTFVNNDDVPVLMENVPISPDFSSGDQHFAAPEGMAVKSAIVQKPANLIPENIAEGVNIAGIIGALAAGGGSNVRLASGSFSGIRTPYTVEHNLGVIPDFVISYGLMSSPNDSCLHVGTSEAGAEKLGFDKARCWRFWRYASDNYYKITSAERGYDNSASGELAISAVTETTFDVGMKDKPINKNFPQCWIALALTE